MLSCFMVWEKNPGNTPNYVIVNHNFICRNFIFTFSASLFQSQNYYLTDGYQCCTQDFLSRSACVVARLLERKFFIGVTLKSCIYSKHFEKRKYIYSCWLQIRNPVHVSLYCKLLILCSFFKKRLGAHTGGTV